MFVNIRTHSDMIFSTPDNNAFRIFFNDMKIKIRIILLKLYERFVMEKLGEVYEQANAALSEAGVLQDMEDGRLPAAGPAGKTGPLLDPSIRLPVCHRSKRIFL